MPAEHKDETHALSVVELDRRAWNLPAPVVVPVGPVREVWPVRPAPSRDPNDGFFDFGDPEAA
ncbi:MAG: hypothetical protein ACRDQT_11595 [Gaiellaceae bacterium]